MIGRGMGEERYPAATLSVRLANLDHYVDATTVVALGYTQR